MKTRFYENLPKIGIIQSFHILSIFHFLSSFENFNSFSLSIADTPDKVADLLLKSFGHMSWRDTSLWTLSNRLAVKIIDVNWWVLLIGHAQQFLPAFRDNPDLH